MSTTWCEHEVRGYCETCEITRLEKKCAELRKDAERYRYLRNDSSMFGWQRMNKMSADQIDASIDAAMKGE